MGLTPTSVVLGVKQYLPCVDAPVIYIVMDFFEDDQASDQGPTESIVIPPSSHSWEVCCLSLLYESRSILSHLFSLCIYWLCRASLLTDSSVASGAISTEA